MNVIGLTGGIGAGKSTVSSYLREKGYLILDADQIAHDITAKGSPVLIRIADAFGAEMIREDGNLDRKKLAAVVFSDKQKKLLLEEITTRQVVKIIAEKVEELRKKGKYDIIFVDAPLLFEAGVDAMTDFVWMVTAADDVRISRVMERDHISREDVLRRIANQMSNEEKIRRSNEVIDNSHGKDELYRQIELLLTKYVESR